MVEDLSSTRYKKLFYKANYRGTKELDVLIGRFATNHLATMDEKTMQMFEIFLEENEHTIYHWIMGYDPVPQKYQSFIDGIRCHQNK